MVYFFGREMHFEGILKLRLRARGRGGHPDVNGIIFVSNLSTNGGRVQKSSISCQHSLWISLSVFDNSHAFCFCCTRQISTFTIVYFQRSTNARNLTIRIFLKYTLRSKSDVILPVFLIWLFL